MSCLLCNYGPSNITINHSRKVRVCYVSFFDIIFQSQRQNVSKQINADESSLFKVFSVLLRRY